MIYYLTDAKHLGGFRFRVRFNTGDEGDIDLRQTLIEAPGDLGRLFEADREAVRNFYLDPWPTLAWKCGYDIAPEYLYELFTAQNLERVAERRTGYGTSGSKGSDQ